MQFDMGQFPRNLGAFPNGTLQILVRPTKKQANQDGGG